MPQPIFPGLPSEPGNPIEPTDSRAAEELPAERSKFSRWLASFGLGETPIPLLRPRKPASPLRSGDS